MFTPPSLARRAIAVGVGIFALWQLFFLLAANLMNCVPRRPGPGDLNPPRHGFQEYGSFTDVEPVQRAADMAGNVLDIWAELSGQEQGWKMFVPGIPPYSLFTAVEFRFPDGEVVQIRSEFEPTDLHNPPVRPPLVRNRRYNFESQFTLPGWYSCPESLALQPVMWSQDLPKAIQDQHLQIIAWMKWRLSQYLATHPDRCTPSEVVLLYRFIPSPLPGEPHDWTQPVTERPYARWLPFVTSESGYLPVEAYNPITNQYVRFPVEGTR
jgi:hypothetical protein